jgi:hypothetical protein
MAVIFIGFPLPDKRDILFFVRCNLRDRFLTLLLQSEFFKRFLRTCRRSCSENLSGAGGDQIGSRKITWRDNARRFL